MENIYHLPFTIYHLIFAITEIKTMRTFLQLSIYCVLFSVSVQAQQLPVFTQYRDSWMQINPATLSNDYINYENNFIAGVSHRQQWTDPDIIGSPITSLAQFQYISADYNFLAGGYFINDQTGDIGSTGVYGNFAYQVPLGKGRIDQTLSIGLSAGLVQYRVDLPAAIRGSSGAGMAFSETILYPDFGLGLYYLHDEKFYAGVSIPQLFGLDLTLRDREDPNNSFPLTKVRHYYALLGGYFDFDFFESESSFFEPSLWIRYVENLPLSFDFNIRYKPSDHFWLGAGYGTGTIYSGVQEQQIIDTNLQASKQVLHMEAGVVLLDFLEEAAHLKIGFGYDVQLSQYLVNFGNSFEVHVIYSWQ